ncbi:3'-5' exonuclease-like [Nicotiana tabacum]|uniref:3'-5' exonuclease-like n=1 Tax=Nicotiana tabacum TaxID=4097 RepID=A0A1S4AP20_TOBAC|nr:PREDICTED: Werner Syndrome-like exonuclease [Nicotiana tabacum]
MAEVYGVSFYSDQIEVTVTKNAIVVNDWILHTIHTHRRRLHKLLIGLDIEWLPYFNPKDKQPVALLQLCVGRRCLLFQLLHKDSMPGYLAQFLSNPNFTFVGVGVEGDAEKLMCDHGLFVANTVDLNRLALLYYGEYVYGKMGLKRMAKAVLGKVMEKPENVTLSKWDAENLSYEQVEYGAIDAFVSFEIGKKLFNEMAEREKALNCHYQRLNFHYQPLTCHYPPRQQLQETQGMFQNLALF